MNKINLFTCIIYHLFFMDVLFNIASNRNFSDAELLIFSFFALFQILLTSALILFYNTLKFGNNTSDLIVLFYFVVLLGCTDGAYYKRQFAMINLIILAIIHVFNYFLIYFFKIEI